MIVHFQKLNDDNVCNSKFSLMDFTWPSGKNKKIYHEIEF